MSKRSVYQKLRIPTDRRKQIQSFTRTSQQGIYRGALRSELERLGYGRLPVTLTNADALGAIDEWSGAVADSIIATYNQYLQNRLDELSPDLSEDAMLRALQPFLDRVRSYNQTVLVPYTSAWTRQRAISDFYARNNIQASWRVVPGDTNQVDVCLDAIQASPMSTEEAMTYTFPAHQRCPHALVPTIAPGTALPDISVLWKGQ